MKSASAYPIYTDPSLRLHNIFGFKYNLAEAKVGDEQKDYMRDAGSTASRIWGGIKGAVANIQHVNQVGPKALNGGEVIISAGKSTVLQNDENLRNLCMGFTDGKCEYMYRMQNTVDHTNISELARLIGVEAKTLDHSEETKQPCGDACAVEAK